MNSQNDSDTTEYSIGLHHISHRLIGLAVCLAFGPPVPYLIMPKIKLRYSA